jgi:hypothetical protein
MVIIVGEIQIHINGTLREVERATTVAPLHLRHCFLGSAGSEEH